MTMSKSFQALESDVLALATPIGRRTGTKGHETARHYLLERMSSIGLAPYSGNSFDLPYQESNDFFHNLVGVLPGKDSAQNAVLIGAHYDSVIDAPCADDNAAAVAIALSAAEVLKAEEYARDVVIALFDAEEPPHFLSRAMGSIRFYEDQRAEKEVHCAIIMDLVGHNVVVPLPGLEEVLPHLPSLLFMTGAESHPMLKDIVKTCRRIPELPVISTQNHRIGDMSDHHIFRVNAVPYLFLSCGRWPHYHQETDTPEKLNYKKMESIRDYLVQLTKKIIEIELPLSGEVDTIDLEILLIKEVMGETLSLFLDVLGLPSLESQKDLDALAFIMQSFGV